MCAYFDRYDAGLIFGLCSSQYGFLVDAYGYVCSRYLHHKEPWQYLIPSGGVVVEQNQFTYTCFLRRAMRSTLESAHW